MKRPTTNRKRVADLITGARLLLGALLAGLGLARGAAALPTAVWLLLVNWTGDLVDGIIARSSRPFYHTWLGDHDLEVDMAVATALLAFLVGAGYVSPAVALLYLLAWLLLFSRVGLNRSLGMLAQAPVYGWFIWVAIREAPQTIRWLLAWIGLVIVITWPRFPKEVIPGFLAGLGLARRANDRTGKEERRHRWSE